MIHALMPRQKVTTYMGERRSAIAIVAHLAERAGVPAERITEILRRRRGKTYGDGAAAADLLAEIDRIAAAFEPPVKEPERCAQCGAEVQGECYYHPHAGVIS